jgi:hypothetical protein
MRAISSSLLCLLLVAGMAALMLPAVPAWADWMPGDPYKMHYPQLPDPNGWDVSFLNGPLGDDWQCRQSGTVDDFHLWVSFRGELAPGPLGGVKGWVAIASNVPPGADTTEWSHPGETLWSMPFDTAEPSATMRYYESGEQRWLEPWLIQPTYEPDHFRTYQINIDVPRDTGIRPFVQEEGQIYWLITYMTAYDPENPDVSQVGWKTSISPHFMDDAVYQALFPPPPWLPVAEPFTGASLDLAFVITSIPEPGTLVLLCMGVVGLAFCGRPRRKR